MKFSQLKRSINDINSFNPAPGQYQITPVHVNGAVFLKGDRFGRIKEAYQELDWIKSCKLKTLEKQQVEQNKLSQNFNINREKIFKKAFTNHQEDNQYSQYNYQKLQLGLLPRLNHQQLKTFEFFDDYVQECLQSIGENDSPGPGSYDIKLDSIKPKIKHFSIKQPIEKKIPSQIENSFIPTQDTCQTNQTNQHSNSSISLVKKIEKNKKPMKQIFSEVGVELQILREKQIKTILPGPGYYDPINSTIEYNNINSSPFQSKVKRFKSVQSIVPSVGQYEIETQISNKGISIPKNQQIANQLSPQNFGPGPGSYNPTLITSKSQKPFSNLYASAFSNGSNRFCNEKERFPGPAEYNPRMPKKKTGVLIGSGFNGNQQMNRKKEMVDVIHRGSDLFLLNWKN